MRMIEIKISDDQARRIVYFLRRKYNKPQHGLNKLAEIAVLEEVCKQAKVEINKIDELMNYANQGIT